VLNTSTTSPAGNFSRAVLSGVVGSSGGSWLSVQALYGVELVRRREVRVAQRHRDGLVLHEFLDGAQVNAGHDHSM
jgi:hypothetical protein